MNLGPTELIVVLLIVLLIFGGAKPRASPVLPGTTLRNSGSTTVLNSLTLMPVSSCETPAEKPVRLTSVSAMMISRLSNRRQHDQPPREGEDARRAFPCALVLLAEYGELGCSGDCSVKRPVAPEADVTVSV